MRSCYNENRQEMTSPTHAKAQKYIKLFRGVKRFEELESRIAALPTPNERGAAFEVFAEAYLATTRKMLGYVWAE